MKVNFYSKKVFVNSNRKFILSPDLQTIDSDRLTKRAFFLIGPLGYGCGEQIAEEKWFRQVTNPNNGEFFQLEGLRAVGAVPSDFRKDEKPKKYPVKKVDSIIRIKKADGSEWLKSRQTWIGLDRI
jgi:hypothetical protein